MTNCGKEILLAREGTEQIQRFLDALDPESVKLNDFRLEEWMQFAWSFAEHVNYFEITDSEKSIENWQKFFISTNEIEKFIEENKLTYFTNIQDLIKVLNEKKIVNLNEPAKIIKFLENESIGKTIEEIKVKYFIKKEKLFYIINEQEIENCRNSNIGNKNITPHLALFVSFLKLIEFTQKRFNNLTKRHLDFYYNKILKIEKLPATPDKVHIIFELAKNSISEKIGNNTELDGGKDLNGNKLIYKTTEELIANKTKVSQLKNVYNSLDNNKIKAAQIANSFDGIGGDFPDDIKWWPFGYFENTENTSEYPVLSNAKIGFAVASKVLELKEGLRKVTLTINFKNNFNSAISQRVLAKHLEIYCSGKKKWLEKFPVQTKKTFGETDELTQGIVPQKLHDKFYSEKEEVPVDFYSYKEKTTNELSITFQITKDEDEIVNYNSEVLGESFDTKLPVCRVLINTGNEDGHALYQKLVENEIENIIVTVNVTGIKSLNLESDIGKISAEKPFYPFGTQPVKKSKFNIGYPELFKKQWKNLNIEINWKNTPDSFRSLYLAYREKHRYEVTPDTFLEGLGEIITIEDLAKSNTTSEWLDRLGLNKKQKAAIEEQLKNKKSNAAEATFLSTNNTINPNEDDLIVTSDDYFKANIEIKNKEEWETANGKNFDKKSLFKFDSVEKIFKTEFRIDNSDYETDNNGSIRISLNQSFLHELFPRIYALSFTSKQTNVLVPNEPYTPLIEEISLGYTAESSITLGRAKKNYSKNDLKLFHEHPFGQSEEHPYLKYNTGFLYPFINKEDTIPTFLMPNYNETGELFIGLENVKNLQTVSLLVQVLEGSENPETESFSGNEKVEWSVLCNNYWKTLNSDNMISDETDNFLKSGIVKFSIPREATSTNTLLPEKLFWVKAKINKKFDAVCKTINISAQSVLAQFSDNKNDLSHLKNGLKAKTISKLVKRAANVKSVSQPYNSFNGKPEESNKAYYQRISERLRHKNRAITLWDYEHIILQQFPEIHKVKCLNHSKTEVIEKNGETENKRTFLAPGNILIVVIPDIVNKNVFDIYQPRVSKATLNAVQNWVNKLNTLHVNAQVINPDYEEVMVELKVKFHKDFDKNYYKKVLIKDITKLLSPWAFEDSARLEFGITMHRSSVINYIENLEYVDYLEDVKLIKENNSSKNVEPSSPTAILVSAKDHTVFLK